MFTREEAGAIMIAEKLVNKFTDVSVNKKFASATDKIKAVLPDADKNAVEELDQSVAIFRTNDLPTQEYPNEFITTIQRALLEKRCVSLSYHAFYSQEKTRNRIVDPLGLVFYGNSWHLIGYCKLRNAMRDFRVDRIQQLYVTNDKSHTQNKPVDINKYFEEYWKNSELIEVKVWFDSRIVNATLSSRYYFGFIDEKEENKGMVMRFAVTSYDYLASWLLSFGDMVIIQQPSALKDEIVKLVKSLSRHYLK
jgi:predicted DNA-binding transcriptional regulator YafY